MLTISHHVVYAVTEQMRGSVACRVSENTLRTKLNGGGLDKGVYRHNVLIYAPGKDKRDTTVLPDLEVMVIDISESSASIVVHRVGQSGSLIDQRSPEPIKDAVYVTALLTQEVYGAAGLEGESIAKHTLPLSEIYPGVNPFENSEVTISCSKTEIRALNSPSGETRNLFAFRSFLQYGDEEVGFITAKSWLESRESS